MLLENKELSGFGIRDFHTKRGEWDLGLKECKGWGMPKITTGITGLRVNLSRDGEISYKGIYNDKKALTWPVGKLADTEEVESCRFGAVGVFRKTSILAVTKHMIIIFTLGFVKFRSLVPSVFWVTHTPHSRQWEILATWTAVTKRRAAFVFPLQPI